MASRMFPASGPLLGYVIVSGLAKGIDTAAHQGALEVGAKTIAVLGTALNQIYPAENRSLADRIACDSGALVTELSRWGVTRVCQLGQMQNPPLLWRHDGRPALGDLVTWTDFES